MHKQMEGMGQSHSCNYPLAQRIQVHFALSKSLSQCTEEPGESAYKVTDSLACCGIFSCLERCVK